MEDDKKIISTTSYSSIREREIKEIKKLLSEGKQIKRYSNNNWFELGGKTFNGFTKQMVDNLIKEVKN